MLKTIFIFWTWTPKVHTQYKLAYCNSHFLAGTERGTSNGQWEKNQQPPDFWSPLIGRSLKPAIRALVSVTAISTPQLFSPHPYLRCSDRHHSALKSEKRRNLGKSTFFEKTLLYRQIHLVCPIFSSYLVRATTGTAQLCYCTIFLILEHCEPRQFLCILYSHICVHTSYSSYCAFYRYQDNIFYFVIYICILHWPQNANLCGMWRSNS